MHEPNDSLCEDALRAFRPASTRALEDSLLESLRSGELRSIRQKAEAGRLAQHPEEAPILPGVSDHEKKLLARFNQTDILASISKPSEPTTPNPPLRKKKPKPSQPETFRLLQFSLFLLVVLIVGGIYLSRQLPNQQPPLDVAKKPQTPAVVVDWADVRWKGESPKLGEPLQPCQLSFESGTVELLFYNGVRSVIEGPADLILMNEGRVFCRQGNWSVTVPPQGIGFEIQTPQCMVRDLGTRFFASIDDRNCDVHVLKGVIELKDSAGKKTVLKTNQSVGVRGDEIFDAPSLAGVSIADRFVTKSEMRRRSTDYFQRHPSPPAAPKTEPVLSVDFRQESPQGMTLFSGSRVQGRSPDSQAFRFDGPDSRIRLKSLGKLSSFTVLIDIKIDRLGETMNPILMSEGSKRGGLVWNIMPQGTMSFGFRRQTSSAGELFGTPVVFTDEFLKQWVKLALCVHNRKLSIYFNGDMVCSVDASQSEAVDLSELDVGNWRLKTNNAGQLDGAVDGIMVFDRMLELEEIRKLAASQQHTNP